MTRHLRRAGTASALAVAVLAVAGCGSDRPGLAGADATGTTTTLVRLPVSVEPPDGPVGTIFALRVAGLGKGATVEFEITFPGKEKAYPGGAMTVADDGTATTSYRATTTNPVGEYAVRVTSSAGVLAEGRFGVSDGKLVTSTIPRSTSSSTAGGTRSSTTRRPGGGATSSTTTRARTSSTTSAAPATTTTLATAATRATTTTTSRGRGT